MQALEAALERQPKDGDLAAQIGAALVATHQYRRALDFYHRAVRNSPANLALHLHLANLLQRLKSWDSAQKVMHTCSVTKSLLLLQVASLCLSVPDLRTGSVCSSVLLTLDSTTCSI